MISGRTKKKKPVAGFFTRLVKEKPLGTVGGVIVIILVMVGIFAHYLAPYGMNEIHITDRLKPPSADYLLGTDNLGRDILSRIIYGARISMYVGLGGTLICTITAMVIGLISGFLGGKTDLVIQRFVDAYMVFPTLVAPSSNTTFPGLKVSHNVFSKILGKNINFAIIMTEFT